MLLKNKVVTVTGGNSGIGKPIVLELARQGANIAADYVSHPDAAEELEERVASLGDHAIGVEADVSKVANLERLIAATVKGFGRYRASAALRRHVHRPGRMVASAVDGCSRAGCFSLAQRNR
jgi:NAD(P)-dependent dehydrogenase (short-subunit alcohol dehydrogenase family)